MPKDRAPRANYAYFREMTTRWRDNDVYGHMNNVVYYEFFDALVNLWLIEEAALPVPEAEVIGLVVETGCVYHASLGWPRGLVAGLGMERVGSSSLTFRIGLFAPDEDLAAAEGRFTHVYVDPATRRPVPLPDGLRAAAEALRAAV
ncbi:acyl-CoA thioesterase [Paroceanicella profunda]|uniref:Acyl-CoA thioesterase n=1 Tax=Paroceanicella profunda TaxID=2579971 RepID=A0A5B8FFT2_9RHOB|nr:thioesterase family protein [Paroceanicella profunda]QDL90341.1 acyl-CoA thioesterase [Paroceanicella profunda]